MKKLLKLLIAALVVIVVGFFGLAAFNEYKANESSLVGDTKNSLTDKALDISGIKNLISDHLENNRESIAQSLGMGISEVDQLINDLDIENWHSTTLPENATALDTFDGTYAGVSGTITVYDDPNYVTVSTFGQDVTLAVPPSAQNLLSSL